MDVLFYGDSITAYMRGNFTVQEQYKRKNNESTSNKQELTLYNAGFENWTTNMIRTYCYPKIDLSLYDTFILQCGINDFFRPSYDEDCKKLTPEEIAKGIIDFTEQIRTDFKGNLILQSLYPVTPQSYERDYFSTLVQDICFVNSRLSKYCKSVNIPFIDMYSELKNDIGEMDEEFSKDGIHPNERGYNKLYNIVKTVILAKKLEDEDTKIM